MAEINPVQTQPCGAKTRQGTPCKNQPVTGKKRCRMHGGAYGSGAPPGNSNALKHGLYSRQAQDNKKEIWNILDTLDQLTKQIKT